MFTMFYHALPSKAVDQLPWFDPSLTMGTVFFSGIGATLVRQIAGLWHGCSEVVPWQPRISVVGPSQRAWGDPPDVWQVLNGGPNHDCLSMVDTDEPW